MVESVYRKKDHAGINQLIKVQFLVSFLRATKPIFPSEEQFKYSYTLSDEHA